MKKLVLLICGIISFSLIGCVSASRYNNLVTKYDDLKNESAKKSSFASDTFSPSGDPSLLDKFVMLPIVATDDAVIYRLGSPLIRDKEKNVFRIVAGNFIKDGVVKKAQTLPYTNQIETIDENDGNLSTKFGFGVFTGGVDLTKKNKVTISIDQKIGAIITLNELDESQVVKFCSENPDSTIITESSLVTTLVSVYQSLTAGATITSPAISVGGNVFTQQGKTLHGVYNGVLYTVCDDAIKYYNARKQKILKLEMPTAHKYSLKEQKQIREAYENALKMK